MMVLRNYAPHKGLCNGTRLIVERISNRLEKAGPEKEKRKREDA